jgi:2-keto-3-deoxy-L-rhamnonate aldolase RhmA
MIKSNPVKALHKAGKPAFGTWITLCPHPRVVKMFASVGLDFVLIEMEHTDFSFETVGVLSMLAREAGLTPIGRTPGILKPHDLTRALDGGAQGLLLPGVETAEQLADIVKATKYYPLGIRPMNLRGPHTDYFNGTPRQIIDHLNAETMTVVMIESRRAIDNLPDMLKVPGLDCIMVGPDDLSQDLGAPGELQAPALMEAFEEIFALCREAGIPYGLSAQSPEMAKRWVEKGCTWIPYQNDAAMVLNTVRAVVPELMKIGGRA